MERDEEKSFIEEELFCLKCGSQREVIVDRKARGKIVILSSGRKITTKPIHRSRLCYYHNKKEKNRFDNEKLRGPKSWLPEKGF